MPNGDPQLPRHWPTHGMTIDRKSIEHLERLARIELTEVERDTLSAQLARIVQFVEKVQSVDTTGAGATSTGGGDGAERSREDVPIAGLDRDDALNQAPDAAGGFFRVPPVIDRGEDASEG